MSGSATGTGTPDGRAPADPATTEAGRLLCAGTYLDPAYRDRVIEELYVHEERFPAPSYGFDATRVLAHALRALRTEATWSAAIVATWGLGLFLTRTFFLFLLLPALLLSGAGRIKKRRERIGRGGGRIFEWILRGYACFVLARILWGVLRGFFADDAYVGGSGGLSFLGEYLKQVVMDNPLGIFLEVPRIGESYGESYSWTVVLIAVLVTVLVGFRREHFAQIIHSSLSRAQYADRGADPTAGRRFRRVRDEIERSQHAQVVLYEVGNPFCGAGKAHLPWQLAVELRPRAGTQARRLDNGAIIEQIRPKLEALRIPSPRGSRRRRTPCWTGCASWSSTSACSCRPPDCPTWTRWTCPRKPSPRTGPARSRRAASGAGTSCASGSAAGTRTSSSPSSSGSTRRAAC